MTGPIVKRQSTAVIAGTENAIGAADTPKTLQKANKRPSNLAPITVDTANDTHEAAAHPSAPAPVKTGTKEARDSHLATTATKMIRWKREKRSHPINNLEKTFGMK